MHHFISDFDTAISIICWCLLLLVSITVFFTSLKMFSGLQMLMGGGYETFDDLARPISSGIVHRRPKARVQFSWNEYQLPRVGRLESLTITYLNSNGTPYKLTIDDEDMVKVTIKLNSDDKDFHDPTGIFSEVGFTMTNPEPNIHHIQFNTKKSGVYITSIRIYETHITGSPFFQKVIAGPMHTEKSMLLGTYPPPAFGISEELKLTLEIRDSFDNLCRGIKDVDTDVFNLTIEHTDNRDHGKMLNDGDFEVWFAPGSPGKMIIGIRVLKPGIFLARLEYENRLIRNGIFELVALYSSEMLTVKAFSHSDSHSLAPYTFEAEFQEDILPKQPHNNSSSRRSKSNIEEIQRKKSSSKSSKTRSSRRASSSSDILLRKSLVSVVLSEKNVFVNKKFWKFFNKRIKSGKVSLNTKIVVNSVDIVRDKATFEISDGISAKIELTVSTSALRIACAIIFGFIRHKSGSIGNFSDKVNYFYEVLKSPYEHLHQNSAYLDIYIDRKDVLLSAFYECQRLWKKDWYRHFKVEFENEPGVDGGGIRREFFEVLCTELFESSGLFSPIGNSRLVHPNPDARKNSRWSGKMYYQIWEFCGRIVGKTLFESAMGGPYKLQVKAKFSRSFLAQILGLNPNYKYFEHDDPELYTGKVKYILENDITSTGEVLHFVDEEYDEGKVKVIDLVPNGSTKLVTEGNKVEYLNAIALYRLRNRVYREIAHFLRGLNSIIPEDSLCAFDENELELLICGKTTFTLQELQKYHRLGYENFKSSYAAKHARIMNWFWITVGNMSEDEKGRLLQFITGSSILPTGGLRRLVPIIEIKPVEEIDRFPQASVCSNLLTLPDQRDFDTFEKRLLLAITEGCQGFEMI